MLVEYVRNEHGRRIGVVVALDNHSIGWSAVREKEKRVIIQKGRLQGCSAILPRDHFDKDRALEIAIGRANMAQTRPTKKVPPVAIQKVITKMQQRAAAYFKPGQYAHKYQLV